MILPDHIMRLVEEYEREFNASARLLASNIVRQSERDEQYARENHKACQVAGALVAYLAEERAAPRAQRIRVFCFACRGGGGQALTGRPCDRCGGSGWEPE